MSSVLYAFRDGIARITLNRPDKLNSFTAAMHGELRQAIQRVRAEGARALLIAGQPLNEPIVQHGPFVMNSRDQIIRAVDDFRAGRLA